jgi:hypothetical protein
MKSKASINPTWLIPLICLALIPKAAYGYLDPQTGSLVLQVLVGGLLTTLAAVRIYWGKLKKVFSKGTRQIAKDEDKRETARF